MPVFNGSERVNVTLSLFVEVEAIGITEPKVGSVWSNVNEIVDIKTCVLAGVELSVALDLTT